MITWIALIFNIILMIHWSEGQFFTRDPDIIRNTSQLIQSRGFDSEIHYTVTQDGYILTLIRLINPYIVPSQRNRLKPVYMQHGLFGNSDDFLISHREVLTPHGFLDLNTFLLTNCTGLDENAIGRSLSYVLSACGFDVWLGNHRGNRYSNRHLFLNSTSDTAYWSFTIDHLSLYDLTTNIDYILRITRYSQLIYVGHSLGTSVMFQLLSYRPEYSRYIKPAIMLAPVAYISRVRSPVMLLAYNKPFRERLRNPMPFFGLPPQQLTVVDQLISTFICNNKLFRPLCTLTIFLICGFDYPNLDQSLVPFAYGHIPDDTSSLLVNHLFQRIITDGFGFYDYGSEGNLQRYSNVQAPIYNLSRIDSRYLILISGINDWLADPDDVDELRSHLSVPLYKDYVVPYNLFNHNDFLTGNNVGQLQNRFILQWISEIFATDGNESMVDNSTSI